MEKFVSQSNLALIINDVKLKLTDADAALLAAAKTYADTKVANLGSFAVVGALPTENIDAKVIYLVPKASPTTDNLYDEFIYAYSKWEKIGDTVIDLTGYATKEELDAIRDNVYTKAEVDAAILAAAPQTMTAGEITAFMSSIFPA